MIERFENGDFTHACTGESFVYVIESTDFEGDDLIRLIGEGLVDGAIGTLTDFFELFVVGLELHKNEIIIISRGGEGKITSMGVVGTHELKRSQIYLFEFNKYPINFRWTNLSNDN